ncbi:[citrate (pro-3S)-lyase] ligase [Hominifimenecus sp. rT4P-3]|uniref:[citrate (pro-3S)-lyase] ligase n=1 Tax=Hominifimenecus sp. rT4P-3 TaxID=3242979 RepID=UPI003DA555F4
MSEYTLSEIRATNKRDTRKMDALLEKEGIQRDKNLDYSVGLFDEDYNLVATGSCFKNTLRCMAVDSGHQGEGLLNQVVSHLMEHQYERGNIELFLYTKCDSAKFFNDLGFYEIARVDGKVVFMENRRTGFQDYLNDLKKTSVPGEKIAAVVMNANPFTLGHQYLLEKTASENDVVHVFVVSEDVSLVPFDVRFQLVKAGSAHLKNLVYHPTGSYIISNATFPSYFLKDEDLVIRSHAKLDINVFKKIAASLGVNRRYVGEEPFSQVTGIYNQVMKEELDACGVECVIVPRKTDGTTAISASKVRKAIQEDRLSEIQDVVPASTYEFFLSEEAKPVIQAIKNAEEVIHY